MSGGTEEVRLVWEGEERFTATRAGFETPIDGRQETGPSPVGLLMEAIAACAAIDVVLILEKGRQDLRALEVATHAERRDEPPRYLTRLRFDFELSGDVEEPKARRAVMLSFEKYCSVFHSLRRDIDLEWNVTVTP